MGGKSDNKHAHTKFAGEIVFCGCHKAQPMSMSLKSLFGTKFRTPPYRWDIPQPGGNSNASCGACQHL